VTTRSGLQRCRGGACLAAAGVAILLCGSALAVPLTFTIPESKLLGGEFAVAAWGGPVLRSDVPGPAVQFTFSDLNPDGAGLKDDYPVDPIYGQILPSHANGDFSNFGGYTLWARNLDADPIWLSLFINTGFTGPSGFPSDDPRNDTFWHSPWLLLPAGEAEVLFLDFAYAVPWHVEDNPWPHTQGGSDGVPMAINLFDRTEVDAIGFQLFADKNPEAAILVAPCSIPEPSTLILFSAALAGAIVGVRRRQRRTATYD